MPAKLKTGASWVIHTELVWVSLVLLTLTTLFLSQPILTFSHTYFSPMDILQNFPTFVVSPTIASHNTVISDDIVSYLPWHEFAANSLSHWQWPLWNPYNAGGRPLLANMEGSFLDPMVWPDFIFGQHLGLLLEAILYLYAAGLSAFLYFKSLRVWTGAALIGGVAFMFCGMSVVWLHTVLGLTFILFPLLLMLVESRLNNKLSNRQFVIWVSVVIAWQVFAGHPETIFLNTVIVTIYLLFRLAVLRGINIVARLRILGLFALAGLFGLAFSAIQLFPFVEYLLNSATLDDRSGLQVPPMPFKFAMSFLLPNPFGSPTFHSNVNLNFIKPESNYNEVSGGYVGLTVIALALFSLWVARRPLTWFWLVMSFIGLEVVYGGWPFFQLISSLSPVAIMYDRLVGYTGFFLIAMMVQGLDEFYRRWQIHTEPVSAEAAPVPLNRRRWRLSTDWQIGLAGLITVGLSVGLFWWLSNSGLVPFQQDAVSDFEVRQFGLVLLGLIVSIVSLWAAWRWPQLLKLAVVVVICCISGQLGWFGHDYRIAVDTRYFYPQNETLTRLSSEPGRLAVASNPLMPGEVNMHFGINLVTGRDSLEVRWYQKLIKAAQAASPTWESQPVLNLLNIKQILVPTTQTGFGGPVVDNNPSLTRVAQLPYNLSLYYNSQAQPSYRMIYAATIQDEVSAIQSLISGQVNSLDTVVFMQGQSPTLFPANNSPTPLPAVEVLEKDANHAKLHVNNPQPGYLYLDQTYFPGWQARINGKDVPLYRADVAFTALPVPAGDLTVELEYNPLSFRLGLSVSLFSLVTLILLANWRRLSRLVRRRNIKSGNISSPLTEPLAEDSLAG